MIINVYSCTLNKAQRDAVNTFGWDVAPAYLKVTGNPTEENANILVIAAALSGNYVHGCTIDVEGINKAFEATNGYGPKDCIVWRNPTKGHSGSVGDVFINSANEGWLCLPCGWAKLNAITVRHFQCNVTTTLKLETA